MTHIRIRIRVHGARLDEHAFRTVLPRFANRLGMVAWTIYPGAVTLQVSPNEPHVILDSVVSQIARKIGGTAKRDGWHGYVIHVPTTERIAA